MTIQPKRDVKYGSTGGTWWINPQQFEWIMCSDPQHSSTMLDQLVDEQPFSVDDFYGWMVMTYRLRKITVWRKLRKGAKISIKWLKDAMQKCYFWAPKESNPKDISTQLLGWSAKANSPKCWMVSWFLCWLVVHVFGLETHQTFIMHHAEHLFKSQLRISGLDHCSAKMDKRRG